MSGPLPDGPLDTLGMWDAIVGVPEQISHALENVAEIPGLPGYADVQNILVIGTGASGVAGEVLRVAAQPFCAIPIIVHHGYSLPSWVSPSTLCIALSYGGETDETLECAESAAMAGAHVVAVSRGGRLASIGTTVIHVDAELPRSRTALGALAVPAFAVLEQLGAFPGATNFLRATAEHLARRRDVLATADGETARLARRIGRTAPIVYGGGSIGAIAAERWKTQINENAKAPAFFNAVPELLHNELAGWGQHGDMTRQVFTLVTLRHDNEHPQVMRAFDLVADIVDEVVAERYEVRAEGDTGLDHLFDLMFHGELVSYHLAQLNEIDPGPVPVVDHIKHELQN